jgi:CHAT domain-containing protein
VWLEVGDRPERARAGALALAPRTDVLPGTSREVAALERISAGPTSVLRAGEATEEAFRRLAPTRGVLHLATYGVLNTHNPLFSYVDLAQGGGEDGRLEVHEVFGLDLAAELVVLSACQTALGSGALADVPNGDDWLGLTRAFLHAGAARVVATLWAVEDRSTADLMEEFYDRRAEGAADATALAQAQRNLLAANATAHPFHWAGVVLVGHQRRNDAR